MAAGLVKDPGLGGLPNLAQAAQQAQGSMNQAITASNNTTSGAMMGLGQQLKQQQGQAAQGAVNRGLGNTSVMNAMQQMPMQNYNMGVANVQNQGAERLAQLYSQLAQLKLQGGEDMLSGNVNLMNAGTSQAQQQANAAVPTQTGGYSSIRPDANTKQL